MCDEERRQEMKTKMGKAWHEGGNEGVDDRGKDRWMERRAERGERN